MSLAAGSTNMSILSSSANSSGLNSTSLADNSTTGSVSTRRRFIPALVVLPSAMPSIDLTSLQSHYKTSQVTSIPTSPSSPVSAPLLLLTRSFKDNRFHAAPLDCLSRLRRSAAVRLAHQHPELRTAFERAMLWIDRRELPPNWGVDAIDTLLGDIERRRQKRRRRRRRHQQRRQRRRQASTAAKRRLDRQKQKQLQNASERASSSSGKRRGTRKKQLHARKICITKDMELVRGVESSNIDGGVGRNLSPLHLRASTPASSSELSRPQPAPDFPLVDSSSNLARETRTSLLATSTPGKRVSRASKQTDSRRRGALQTSDRRARSNSPLMVASTPSTLIIIAETIQPESTTTIKEAARSHASAKRSLKTAYRRSQSSDRSAAEAHLQSAVLWALPERSFDLPFEATTSLAVLPQ
ncbi:unnamed protein product [Protopolystoma xenopodis]|uniref:Uncharacterized protein n=1 Tax=Protopolystoma xenopodis TaxID=117903 RepID=A0A3S5AJK6_9PLAT|nr:unnamed protein product [Protopolystoma xenopodis]